LRSGFREKHEVKISANMKKVVFSGIQPTGDIHIGNYLGAIRNWVGIQAEFKSIFCVVDLHAITVPQDPQVLRSKIRQVAAILLAAGIDPDVSVLFIQSDVSAHAELAWILNCFIPLGWMHRMTQFKEKSEQQKENVSVGLFDYPALMASDILLYKTDLVPVGADQKQHLELTRDVAQRFNSIYGETFNLPGPMISDAGARVMALDDPQKKMSKSDSKVSHSIGLLDRADDIRSKVMRATTDSGREIRFETSGPGVKNLLSIYELFTTLSRVEIEARFEGRGYADLKGELAEVIIEGLGPLQRRYWEFMKDPQYVSRIMAEGAERVRAVAEETLGRVKEKIGLG
jgi:tryptophanyl-tRNA synthetase